MSTYIGILVFVLVIGTVGYLMENPRETRVPQGGLLPA